MVIEGRAFSDSVDAHDIAWRRRSGSLLYVQPDEVKEMEGEGYQTL